MSQLPALKVDGIRVVEKDSGKRVHLVGLSEFAMFKRYLMPGGPAAYVAPVLVERKKLAESMGWKGPIFIRVFRHARASNVFGITDPWSYADSVTGHFDKLTEFCNFCGDYGFYVDLTAGDFQDCFPNPVGPKGQQQHVNETIAALVQCPNAIFQLSNEPFQNGCIVHPKNTPPTAGQPNSWGDTLKDSGYYANTVDWDHSMDLQLLCDHTERGDVNNVIPKFIYDMPVAASYMLELGKPVKLEEPIGADENIIPGRRTNRANLFKQMGEVASYGVGVYFHSTLGLSSDGFSVAPRTQECFENFFAGVAGVVKPGV